MIFFGTGENRIKNDINEPIKCPSCGERSLRFYQFSKYFHLYWIPVFPIGKRTASGCDSCGQVNTDLQLDSETEQKLKQAGISGKHPFVSFIGLAIILVGIAAFTIASQFDKEFEDNIQTSASESDILYNGVGKTKNDKPHGIWVWKEKDGTKRIEGRYVDGLEEGEWVYWSPEGVLFKKEQYKNGMLHGITTTYYPEGDKESETMYFENREHGHYKYWYDDGTLAVDGFYVRSKMDSVWSWYSGQGILFRQGTYKLNEPLGIWKVYYDDGSPLSELEAVGSDMEEKVWNVWELDGTQIVKDGNGTYVEYYTEGERYTEGEVVNGNKTGLWKFWYQNGDLKEEIRFDNGKRFQVSYWTTDGTKTVVDGNGTQAIWYSDNSGIYNEGDITDGVKNGLWTSWYENGTKRDETNFEAGVRQGESKTWDENGRLAVIGDFNNNERAGIWKWWWSNGIKQCEVKYVDGKKTGVQTFWSESEEKVKEEVYENGVLVDTRTF